MNTRKLRILLLADSTSFHTERFTAELRRQGCHVLIASLERGRMHHYHLKPRMRRQALNYMMSALETRRLIARFRPHIINPHFASGYGFSAALATIGKSIPVVLNLWGSDILLAPQRSFLHKRRTSLALKAADCVVGDSEHLIATAKAVTPLSCKRVIPWGVEQRFLCFHKESYAFQHPLRIIVPRPHEKLYNNLFIVRSLMSLVHEGKVEITFTNFGSLVDDFRRQGQALTDKRLRFYDIMPREKFLRFMAEHDVYLSASRSDSSPASLIEAMALGLLPIAADIPGVKDWLTAESGFVFRKNDTEDLKNLVHGLLHRQDPYELMRKKNLDRVKREAVFENNVAEQIDLMKELLAGRGR
jgi:glycosyltransferase involved in cell wall biosynthesis